MSAVRGFTPAFTPWFTPLSCATPSVPTTYRPSKEPFGAEPGATDWTGAPQVSLRALLGPSRETPLRGFRGALQSNPRSPSLRTPSGLSGIAPARARARARGPGFRTSLNTAGPHLRALLHHEEWLEGHPPRYQKRSKTCRLSSPT